MKTSNDKYRLIRKLLSDKLDEKGRQELSQLDIIEEEMKKQWNELDENLIEAEIGKQIWNKIERKCEKKKVLTLVHLELWQLAVACVSLLLLIGGYWMYSSDNQSEEFMEIMADKNKLYVLPDSSKVWMQPGSTIRFAKNFIDNRNVWLKGNSLFEVYKHRDSKFRVYIDRAFIEVKGTSFLIKQSQPDKNEITLFNGSIEFNIETTGSKIAMKPLQEIIYNPRNASTEMRQIENIEWQNGRYDFTDISLKKLIQTINQMYGSDIVIEEEVDKECAFTGSIRHDESLNDVVDKICFTLNLHAKEENGRVIIYN